MRFKIYYRNIIANETTYQWVCADNKKAALESWFGAVSSNQEFLQIEEKRK